MVDFPRYESYKDSGVEWLEEIPSHWDVKKLKFVAKQISEKVEMKEQTGNYLGLENIESWTGKIIESELIVEGTANKFQHNDILFGKLRPYLAKVHLAEQEGFCTTEALVLRVSNQNVRYFSYLLLSQGFIELVNSSVYGSKMPRASWEFIGCKFLPLPTLEEQKRIAKFLDRKTSEIDQAIAQKQRLIELLQEQKAILINQAVTKGLDPNVPMCDSRIDWIGEIPEHWQVKRVKHVTRQIIDGAHLTPTYVEDGVPFLRVTDISARNKTIDLETVKRIPKQEHIELCKRTKATKGDILLSKNGTIGITKLVDWDFEFSFFVSLCLIKPKKELIPDYFCLFFDSPLVDEQLTFGSKQTSVTNLHLDKIKELLIVLPPIKEQLNLVRAIENQFEPYNKLINTALNEITLLTEYKQILIASAVTGKIKA